MKGEQQKKHQNFEKIMVTLKLIINTPKQKQNLHVAQKKNFFLL